MNATISHLNYKEEISAIPDIDDSKSHFLPSEPKDFLASCLGLENPLHLYDVTQLSEKSRVTDEKLIRAGCFNHDGDMFVIGTNTKALFGYSLVPLLESIRPGTGDYSQLIKAKSQTEPLLSFDIPEHHEGSIYCIDWSDNEQFIATGSNDKQIKIIINPSQRPGEDDIFQLLLTGHQNKVRALTFQPGQSNTLLSGGDGESVI